MIESALCNCFRPAYNIGVALGQVLRIVNLSSPMHATYAMHAC